MKSTFLPLLFCLSSAIPLFVAAVTVPKYRLERRDDDSTLKSYAQHGFCFFYFTDDQDLEKTLRPCIAYCGKPLTSIGQGCDISSFLSAIPPQDITNPPPSQIDHDDDKYPYVCAKGLAENGLELIKLVDRYHVVSCGGPPPPAVPGRR
ncbi:hypothetical protein F4778DRAFT_783945 [Xylariomycetidae sp. FL2044]|nr:hypothetical protein F4778DRAFT_783945 [Xylariomycetidae sp. FL2044]